MLFSTDLIRRYKLLAACLLVLLIAACGGGGGGSSSSTPPANGGGTTAPPVGIVSPMGCGTVTATGSGNATPIVVDGFPCAAAGAAGIANSPQVPYVSVKICAPGTSTCQTIDHVILDSGSSGLRIAASALATGLRPGAGLPYYTGASATGSNLTECELYVASFVYGPIVNVDVYIAGESVKNTQIQVFGDTNYPANADCKSQAGTGTETDTVALFGGNGLLGVNFAPFDGGAPYYDCNGTPPVCTLNTNFTFQGIPNIVTQFATDNNGVAISLPAISATGTNTPVSGTLYFGIGTQTNNQPLANTMAIQSDGNLSSATFGTFEVQVDGGSWTSAYIDSGTGNAYFSDSANAKLIACTASNFSGWYCPVSTQSVALNYANFNPAATYNTASTLGTINLSVANPNYLTNNTIAFDNIAGTSGKTATISSEVALGLTTFFGHTNYVLFANMTAPGANLGGGATVTGPVNGIQTP